LRDGRICSGDSYGYIKIWSVTAGVCEMTLYGHTAAMKAIVVIEELKYAVALIIQR
jgi:hypothetical protein